MKKEQNSRSSGSHGSLLSRAFRGLAAALLVAVSLAEPALAQSSNVSATRHNLSKTGTGTAKATNETEICAFCHTPHGANTNLKGPLWNRSAGAVGSYTRYTSSSLDANTIIDGFNAQPGGSSLLCLSCHDGTVALGNVNVLGGQANVTVTGLTSTMPAGSYGETSGYTRRLGTDLSNDHPISITYNDTLATTDGEMTRLNSSQKDVNSGGTILGIRSKGYKPLLPLEPTGPSGTGQVQCATCHDPHKTSEKFLRANRLQTANPIGAAFNQNTDIICRACHDKLGSAWALSAHADSTVANETYKSGAAKLRDFTGTAPQVWQVACLNCHDTHTASGSRRLLREGVGGTWSSTTIDGQVIRYQPGTATRPLETVAAIENTCYQCHTTAANSILVANTTVPDIETEFNRIRRMPLKSSDQGAAGDRTKEIHDITNADFMESETKLGYLTPANRHVECTDCHNPHRVRRGSKFTVTPSDSGEGAKRTHNVGGVEGNVISGALRGTWGVEPVFGAISSVWPQNPTFPPSSIKRGDPGTSTSVDRSSTYVTREYQLCFKCHSNYSNGPATTDFPSLGNSLGGTPTGTNGMSRYTNVAAEFGSVNATDPPSSGTDQGEAGNSATYTPSPSGPVQTNNHRSWHPVMWPTGRTRAERGSSTWDNLRAPYKLADTGIMTMHCSDCHGSEVSWTQGTSLTDTAGGPNTNVQGPHGSGQNFLLKGKWDDTVTPGNAAGSNTSGSICGRCHDPSNAVSGFAGGNSEASHSWSPKRGRYCMFCHVAVPHGWKNKAFLVNLNCVQSEASGYGSTCSAVGGNNATSEVTLAPYYNRARLRIASWAQSGSWGESNCVSKDWMSSACGY